MNKRSALGALSLCALLAWESAVADTSGPVTTGGAGVGAARPVPAPAAKRSIGAQPAPVQPAPGLGRATSGTAGTYESGMIPYDPMAGGFDARRQYGAPAILADLVLLRPFGVALTAAGAGLFIATSPLAAIAAIAPPHDALERSGNALVVAPAAFTFMRPLGEFTYQPTGVYPIRP